MRRLIEEYGTTLLYIITGILCIVLFSNAFFGEQSSVSQVINSSLETSSNQDVSILYTITYEGMDGANFTSDVPTTYTKEDRVFLPIPKKTGYLFAGWVGTRITEPTINVIIPEGSTGNRSYTATWTQGYYRTIFDTNSIFYQTLYSDIAYGKITTPVEGALVNSWFDGENNSLLYEYGEYPTMPSPSFSFKGHKFIGWNTKPDGSGTMYLAGTSSARDITERKAVSWAIEEVVLYAQWERIVYSIEYERAYNMGVADFKPESTHSTYVITDRFAPVEPVTDAVMTGYDLAGWYFKDPYLNYPEGIDIYRLGKDVQLDHIVPGMTGNIKLYAMWAAKQYIITYIKNFPECELVIDDDWGISPEINGNACIAIEDIKSLSTEEVLKAKDTVVGNWTNISGDTRYVYYDSPYGEAIRDIYLIPYATGNEKDTDPQPTIAYKYIFKGWYKEPECINKVTPEDIVKTPSDHNLYAKWVPITYYITLHSNWAPTE